jgi:hypothetical protein
MTNQESTPENSQKTKGRTIVVEMTVEDAERVRKAFAEGKLKAIGVTSITELSPEQIHSLSKDWVQRGINKKDRCNDGLPPRQ